MDSNNWRQPPQPEQPTMDGGIGDWRSQLQTDSRQRIVNKIMDTLKRHLPSSGQGQEGVQELNKIAMRFEEKIYRAATSQSDYLRRISLKMLTMESKSSNPIPNAMPSNSAGMSRNPQDPASQSMQPQLQNQGQALSIPMAANQSTAQGRQQLLTQNIQNNISSAGMQTPASLPSALPPVNSLAKTSMPNIIQNSNMPNISGISQNSMGNSMVQGVASNIYANSQKQMQGRQNMQQVGPQQQIQQSQNQQQYTNYQQQLQQQQLMKQKLQQGGMQQPLLQPHIQQPVQQNMLPPSQLQSSQQSIMQSSSAMQPSMVSGLQQNQPSSVQQSSQSVLQQQQQHPQSVLRQQPQQQAQQAPAVHHQQTQLSQQPMLQSQQHQQQQQQQHLIGQQQIGQQTSISDMQQPQRLLGQQNNLPSMSVQQQTNHQNLQQQQLMGQQNNLSNMHQQHLGSQSHVGTFAQQQQLGSQTHAGTLAQQQQLLGSQSGNSNMQTSQHPANIMQQPKVSVQQPNPNAPALLPGGGQQQSHHQQMMPQMPSQTAQLQQQLGLQQQSSSLQNNMQQRLQPSSALLQQQSMMDPQKMFQSQRTPVEAPSTSLDSTAQTGNSDWQEEVYQKIKAMKDAYFADVHETYQKICSKLQQHDSLPQQSRSDGFEKLKIFKQVLERILHFLQIPKNSIHQTHKEKLASLEKQILGILGSNRPRKPGPLLQQGQIPPHMQSLQQTQQSHIAQTQSHDSGVNSQLQSVNGQVSSVPTMQPSNISGLHGTVSSLSAITSTHQNMMNSLQPASNLDSGQGNTSSSVQQVAMGSIQQNPVSTPPQAVINSLNPQSGMNLLNSGVNSLQTNSNMLPSQHQKQQQEQQIMQSQQLKQQQRHIQQQMMLKQQQYPMQQQQQQLHMQQLKPQQQLQMQGQQMPQLHQMNDVNDLKLRQTMGIKALQQHLSQGQWYSHQQLKSGVSFPISSPQVLQAASPQINQPSPSQVDQQNPLPSLNKVSTPLHSANSPFVPSPPTPLAPPMPSDPEKPNSAMSSMSNAANIIHQQTSVAPASASSLAIGTPGISASPLLAELSPPDGHGNSWNTLSGKSCVMDQPLEHLLKVVKSKSSKALNASVSDIGSVVSMIDRIAGSAPGNGSRAAVGEDLVAMTKCRLQARNCITQDGSSGMKRMRSYTSAMPLNVSSVGSPNNSLKQFTGSETSELESTATSSVKQPRIEEICLSLSQQPMLQSQLHQQQQQQHHLIGQQQIGQQTSISDMQQQQQSQRLLGQQNNLPSMSGQRQINNPNLQQQQLLGQQNNLSIMHQQQLGFRSHVGTSAQQQQLGSQTHAATLAQQQQLLGSQSGGGQQQSQKQHQQMMPQMLSQTTQLQQQLGLQQQSNSLQNNMHQRLPPSSALLQQQSMMDTQKMFQSQQTAVEAPSTSLDSTAQTGNSDWQEEVYQKVNDNCGFLRWETSDFDIGRMTPKTELACEENPKMTEYVHLVEANVTRRYGGVDWTDDDSMMKTQIQCRRRIIVFLLTALVICVFLVIALSFAVV